MSAVEHPGAAACPACLASPLAGQVAERQRSAEGEEVQLSLPTIHCAACISTIEQGLLGLPDVSDVRVNLTRKRASVRVRNGMDAEALVAAVSRLGYEAQPLDAATLSAGASDRAARDLTMRLGVAGFAMMNVMLLSVAVWAGAANATRDMFHWISAAIALPTIAFAAQPFFVSAWRQLRVARLNMDVPISLAILLASAMSVWETAHHGQHAYFDAALSLTFFLLAGRVLDQRMRTVARSAATELAALEAPTALKIGPDGPLTVRLEQVGAGDLLLVQPGARIPVDGVVAEGESEIDRAFLTGETDPVAVAPGLQVRAGEVNLTGALRITAQAVGADTLLHRLADLVSVAEEAKSRYNSLADRAARIYAPAVHLLALAAFIAWFWLTGGDLRVALNVAVAVLIITCPCALGLAVPAVSTVASGRLFKRGLLVKHATALERLAEVDAVVLDKTGTLTRGTPLLQDADALPPEALAVGAALAQASNHPRSRAVAAAAQGRTLPAVNVSDIREVPGHGVQGNWNGQLVRLGRADWAGAEGSATVLRLGDGAALPLQFTDALRPGAAALIAGLKARGLPVTLLSGDTPEAVGQLAGQLGLDDWRAGVHPDDKVAAIAAMKAAGRRVLMVGDGLNDTAAMALAHVAIAPASALEATRVAADLVLVAPQIDRIDDALRIAGAARRRILENFALAAIYNAIAVPIALMGLATPLGAAIAMSSSSIMVSLNALRTR
ncbi:MAG: cadmium-translocating P-type ATPase [Limimaricola sp.]|uniref:heavy metal translocating P-type ATPase n=1 Tax=Limimaricola sp. TaxID=2211665 RepID=UPI001D2472BC|nr:heavy metal translocating P-type ATPase [Limimaricola sp.]MBI1418787.1 cadmium-translocating P-type ATPase [Limimaricola sp.]